MLSLHAQDSETSTGSTLNVLHNTQAAQAYQMDGLNTAAADAHNAANNLKPGQDGYQAGSTSTIGVSASYGSQSSKSETRTESSQSQGNTLTAGRNLNVTATGKNGTDGSGDISITGSQLKAGGDLSLDASRDILLQSAQNTQSTDSTNSSRGGSAGVGIGVGSGGYGISVSASVNAAKGSEKGNGLTHSETTLDAGRGQPAQPDQRARHHAHGRTGKRQQREGGRGPQPDADLGAGQRPLRQ